MVHSLEAAPAGPSASCPPRSGPASASPSADRADSPRPSSSPSCGAAACTAARPSTSRRMHWPRTTASPDSRTANELELAGLPGVGQAKAAQLVAAFELGRRLMADWPAARLVDPRPGRHRRPPDPPDGPPRARGAAGRHPRHEEPRPAHRRPCTRATSRRHSSGSASCIGTRSGSTPRASSSSTTTRRATRRRRPTTCT